MPLRPEEFPVSPPSSHKDLIQVQWWGIGKADRTLCLSGDKTGGGFASPLLTSLTLQAEACYWLTAFGTNPACKVPLVFRFSPMCVHAKVTFLHSIWTSHAEQGLSQTHSTTGSYGIQPLATHRQVSPMGSAWWFLTARLRILSPWRRGSCESGQCCELIDSVFKSFLFCYQFKHGHYIKLHIIDSVAFLGSLQGFLLLSSCCGNVPAPSQGRFGSPQRGKVTQIALKKDTTAISTSSVPRTSSPFMVRRKPGFSLQLHAPEPPIPTALPPTTCSPCTFPNTTVWIRPPLTWASCYKRLQWD